MAKKKKKDTMTGVAVGGMIGMNVVGATAGLSSSPAAATLSSSYATGMGNVGSKFGVVGRIKGTTMVMKSMKGLSKSRKKIKLETKQTKKKPKRPFGYKGVWWYRWKEV